RRYNEGPGQEQGGRKAETREMDHGRKAPGVARHRAPGPGGARRIGVAGWVMLGALAAGAGAEGPALQRFEFRQTHMGSEFKIVLYTTGAAEARRASDVAFARIAALDAALSDYNPESELMRLCDRAGGPPVKVSDDLFRCLQRSQTISERSG